MSRYEDIADDHSSQFTLIVALDRLSQKMHAETTVRGRQSPTTTTTTQTRQSRRRANIIMPVQDRCPPLRSQQSTGCCLSHLVRVHLFFIVISSLCISISQFSCQTTQTLVTNPNNAQKQSPTWQDDDLAALGYESHMPATSGQPTTTTRCNQHQDQKSMSGRSGQQRALREPATNGLHHNRKPNADNANTLPNHAKHHQLNQQTARQQRQFSQSQARSAAMIDTSQGQHQQQQPPAAQEEFSLNSLTSLGGNSQTNGQLLSDQQANATSYAMLASELAVRAQSAGQLESSGSASASSASTTASSSPTAATSQGNPTPPTTSIITTTEQAALPNTTPVLGSETIGSPVAALQPPATTSSSLLGQTSRQASPQQEQQQTRQQGRRIEDSSKLAVERHSSNLSEEHLEQGGRSFNAKAAISSMPSSTSIITPLIGPSVAQHLANEQQQMTSSSPLSSSSSMVKPIYVVGNPIGDLDYSSTMYSEQLHQAGVRQKGQPDSSSSSSNRASGGQSAVSAPHPQRGEKKLDAAMSTTPTTMSQGEQQVTDDGRQQTNTTTGYATTEASYERPSQLAASNGDGDRMNGPALVYSGGHLVAGDQNNLATNGNNSTPTVPMTNSSDLSQLASHSSAGAQPALPAPSPRLIQGPEPNSAAVLVNSPRRPSLPPPVNQANAASGLRSPLSPSGPLIGQPAAVPPAGNSLQPPANSNNQQQQQQPNFYQTSPPYAGSSHSFANGQLGNNGGANLNSLAPISSMLSNKQAFVLAAQQHHHQQQQQQQHQAPPTPTHLSAIPSQFQLPIHQAQQSIQQQQPQASITNQQQAVGPSRRPLNITRVEHISAECSNDLIRAVIVFNGTFKGIIYSSGYVTDPTCLYVNGTGSTRYEFSIRLNQCGTLGRQELHQPTIPGEARRRDQVMWNTLSIQYNPVIEQEWDEHFRVSCEYGSDFWKTISFSPFNVETSTGSPVVFTINPPQCQMDVLLGHGMGPKIAVDGPVTVGDPLTLLIHMKSEKAGYDILVKNCVAHNGGKQRMQLIDSNGCVVNERFISPFRGTYNDNDLRHVTLYAYLKAFRFTGSPVLYLECEIHMCQSACPPQMCYWRRLSKRSVDNNDFEYTDDRASLTNLTANELADGANSTHQPIISDSLSLFKALQVRHEPVEPSKARLRAQQLQEIYAENDEAQLVCYRHAEVLVFMTTIGALLLLVLTVAITCCLRIRKMTRSQFKHSRLQHQHPGSMSSQSPSLLSIDDTYPRSTFSLGSAYSPGNNNSRTNDGGGQFEGHSGASFLRHVAFVDHSASMKPNRQQVPVSAAEFRHKQQEQRRQQSPIKQHNNNGKMYPNSTGSTLTSANVYSLDR